MLCCVQGVSVPSWGATWPVELALGRAQPHGHRGTAGRGSAQRNRARTAPLLVARKMPHSVCCTVAGTPSGQTALLASMAVAASAGGSCSAVCHASRHASTDPISVAEAPAPLENGASKFTNASRVSLSMSSAVPPLPASSTTTSACRATTSRLSILFCCACKACLTKRVARTKNRVPGVARYY